MFVQTVCVSYDRAKSEKFGNFCTHMVDFCRPGHNYQYSIVDLPASTTLQHW